MKHQFIDSIRGVAILMVILVHTATQILNLDAITDVITKYCQMGVQLFFVASAFTLCLSSANRTGERYPLFNYAVRRYFRIAPIYYLGIIMYFSLSTFQIFKAQMPNAEYFTVDNLLYNFFFLHGFVESANNTIVPGGWSIAAEMIFYTIFPMLFFFSRTYITSKLRLIGFVLFGIVVSQLLILALINLGFYLANNTFLYYNICNQLPCFFIGIGYYFYLSHFEKKYSKVYDFLMFIFLTGVALGIWSLKIGYLFSWTPIFSCLSFVFLIQIFRKNVTLNFKVLSDIGKVSFSMYLFHFLLVYSIPLLFVNWTQYGIFSLLPIYLIIVLLTYIIGRLSFLFIEVPFVNLGKKIINLVGKKLKWSFFTF